MEFFRNLVSNKFVGPFLLGIVILGMAVWGTEDIFSGGLGSNIIKAGERGITQQDLDRKFETYLDNLRREQPGNAITRQQAVEQGILDQLFNLETSRLTNLGYARQIGADSSDKALTDRVRSVDAFRNSVTNQFDIQTYRSVLAQNNIRQSQFEADIENELTLDYLRDGVTAAIVAPSELARLQAIYDGEARSIAWMPLDLSALPERAPPTEEELQVFYEAQKTAFTVPERRQLSMLSLSPEDFIHQAVVTDEDIEALYEATKYSRLAVPESRTFFQAIFPNEAAALNAFGVLAGGGQLEDGASGISETRTAIADDIAIEDFRESIFAPRSSIGAVVGPYETPSGWIIGRVVEIIPGTPKPLDEVRDELNQELALQQAEALFYDALNRFDDLIGQGLPLEEIGADFGAPVISFAPIDARGVAENGTPIQALISTTEALAQAFVLPEGTIGDRFEGASNTYVLFVDKVIPSTVPAFEEVRDRALTGFEITQDREALQAAAEAIKSTLESGVSTLDEQAALYGSVVERPATPQRRTAFDRSLPRSVLQAAFSLDDGGIAIVPAAQPGQVMIVQLEAINRPSADELDVLAPVSSGQISTQLTNDLLFAFEQDLSNALTVEADRAAFAAYRNGILEDQ